MVAVLVFGTYKAEVRCTSVEFSTIKTGFVALPPATYDTIPRGGRTIAPSGWKCRLKIGWRLLRLHPQRQIF